jgi:hypothetical protein
MTRKQQSADLFAGPERKPALSAAPLAERMRPEAFDDFVGQNEIATRERARPRSPASLPATPPRILRHFRP